MDFLKNNRLFRFLYDGRPIDECPHTVEKTEDAQTVTAVYTFENGLRITNIARKYGNFGAYEWVNLLENTSDKPTGIISQLYDADCTFDMPHEDVRQASAYATDYKTDSKIYAPRGSRWRIDEFYCDVDEIEDNFRPYHIYAGETRTFSASGGRSSEDQAPFFDIYKEDAGVIIAIGWSGQWTCKITRNSESINICTGIEDTNFKLLAGEKIRTSSIVAMPYTGGRRKAHNDWRRLIKNHFSLVGQEKRDEFGPLCAGIWGGMPSEEVIKRINVIKENKLPVEYIWMDAGWYGEDTPPSPDEFDTEWSRHTGEWVVSPHIHPNGLKDVSKAVHDAGMKFLLWVEPERVIDTTPIAQTHPEYLLTRDNADGNLLLNLGDPAAWDYCYSTLAGLIEDLNVDFYRQDFNMAPAPYWKKRDASDRRGITEIKHIMGLYRLWDALLERFPNLMIDNCSSGGRRIDIENMRRSIALWRSDFQCSANADDYVAQCHTLNFNEFMPYSGTGAGRVYDAYRVRSSYGSSLNVNYAFSAKEPFAETPEKVKFLQKYLSEYKQVRPFYSEDFYPLTKYSPQSDVWCAYQFDRPEKSDGIIQIFKREDSPYTTASFSLGGIAYKDIYTFTDADSNESFSLSGEELAKNGFKITVDGSRVAKLFFYKH